MSTDQKQKPKVDEMPPAPPLSVAMVQASATKQNAVGRLSRLRLLSQRNADVAWLMSLVPEHKLRPFAPKPAVKPTAKKTD